jgi:hypothetical protein
MLVSAVSSVGITFARQQKLGSFSSATLGSAVAQAGKLVALGRLQDAPRLHHQIHAVLQSEYGLSREEAAIWTLQIMTDALRDANSVLVIDASIRSYREQQARVIGMGDAQPDAGVVDELNRKALDWQA